MKKVCRQCGNASWGLIRYYVNLHAFCCRKCADAYPPGLLSSSRSRNGGRGSSQSNIQGMRASEMRKGAFVLQSRAAMKKGASVGRNLGNPGLPWQVTLKQGPRNEHWLAFWLAVGVVAIGLGIAL